MGEMRNGVAFCKVINVAYNSQFPMSKIYKKAQQNHQVQRNYEVLKAFLDKKGERCQAPPCYTWLSVSFVFLSLIHRCCSRE